MALRKEKSREPLREESLEVLPEPPSTGVTAETRPQTAQEQVPCPAGAPASRRRVGAGLQPHRGPGLVSAVLCPEPSAASREPQEQVVCVPRRGPWESPGKAGLRTAPERAGRGLDSDAEQTGGLALRGAAHCAGKGRPSQPEQACLSGRCPALPRTPPAPLLGAPRHGGACPGHAPTSESAHPCGGPSGPSQSSGTGRDRASLTRVCRAAPGVTGTQGRGGPSWSGDLSRAGRGTVRPGAASERRWEGGGQPSRALAQLVAATGAAEEKGAWASAWTRPQRGRGPCAAGSAAQRGDRERPGRHVPSAAVGPQSRSSAGAGPVAAGAAAAVRGPPGLPGRAGRRRGWAWGCLSGAEPGTFQA